MRTIKFLDKALEKHIEAETFCGEAYRKDPEIGKLMKDSYYHCWNILLNMLANANLPKDEYGFEKGEYELQIGPDFVKASFGFCFLYNGKFDMNGGMILHGGGQETFSVELTGANHPHWSIHT